MGCGVGDPPNAKTIKKKTSVYKCFSLVSLSLCKFSHFLSIPRHFFNLICPNICHWFWFYLRVGFFCEMHAFNLGLQLTLSFIQRTCHPMDVSSKGQMFGDTSVGDTSSWHPSSPYSSFQAPCSSFCLFLLPLAPSRPFQLLFVPSSLILIL
jgi:hypothetical protein